MALGICKTFLLFSVLAARLPAADISGKWVVQIAGANDPQYMRVELRSEGGRLGGRMNEWKIDGSIAGNAVELTASAADGKPAASFKGEVRGAEVSGIGTMTGGRGSPAITWKMTRTIQPPASGPKTWDFEPKEFQRFYSAAIAPVLRIFPGDTVRTRTVDSGGLDSRLERRSPGGNPETGPFYIEGALPGDTLAVRLNKVRLNRDTARSGSRINPRIVTPAYAIAAHYDSAFDSEWTLDRAHGLARLAHPTDRLKNYTAPILPMIGCLATAPAGNQSYRAVDLGPFGGNMDYNQMGEGMTLYLPVFQPGALFFLGDGHAAMGDGELTGAALETSLDVEFTVDVLPAAAIAGPRAENAEYLIAMGIAGSIPDAIQAATSHLAAWLKDSYKLNDSEAAILLGTAMKYEIAEMVDPQYNVVAKVPKAALASFK
jgi:acetamidase/formamidase